MKQITRTLPLVFIVLLLPIFVTARPLARKNPNPLPPQTWEIKGQIRWKKSMGLIPIGPGKILASNAACSPFIIVAYEYNASFSGGSKINAYSSRSTSQPTEQGDYYVCDYSLQVTQNKSMFVRAAMGDVDLLPKTLEHSQDPLMSGQPYYLTDRWIGGTDPRPPAGWERGFVDRPSGGTRYLERVLFEMVYLRSTSDPNASSTSDYGPSPLLRTRFAGAWQGTWGGAFMMLILQQTGDRVTGQLNVNSADFGIITDGIIDGNRLSFKVQRKVPNRLNRPYEYVGTGELVMGADGKTFTGTVLGAATSGTLAGR